MDSLNKVCRACLGTNDVFTYIINENVDQEIFLFCTSVRVSKYDCLPKTLCNFCYELINKFSDFKKICIRSNDMLINSIYNIKRQKTELKCEDVDNDEAPLPQTDVKLESNLENDLADDCDDASPKEITTAEDTTRFEELNSEISKSSEKKAFHKCNDINPKCEDVDDNDEAPLPQSTDAKLESNSENDLTHDCDDASPTAEETIRFEELNFELPKSRRKNVYNFSCEKCNRKFKYEEKYEAHKLWHDDGKPIVIKCNKCHKIFKKWQSLYQHITSQHSVVSLSNLQCPTCGRICKSAQTLRGHQLLMHTRKDTELSVCDICGKGFKNKIQLKDHLKTHDTNRLRSHKCDLCDRSFFCRAALTRHKTQCHDDRRYVCDHCSKMYRDKYSLVKHMTIQHQGRRYKCDICAKALATSTSLRDHMRYHTGERPFECGECHKHFVTRKMLTEHRYIHTGEKPHKCDQCTQAFAQRGTLNRHMRVHGKPHRS